MNYNQINKSSFESTKVHSILSKLIAEPTLKFESDDFKKDKKFVLIAVSKDSRNLEYASSELKNNKRIVLTAVKGFGMTLKFASEKLKNDKKVVLIAMKQNINSLKYASEGLQNDMKLLKILRENKLAIFQVNQDWFNLKMEQLTELEIQEQEVWMENNIPQNTTMKNQPKKF